VEAVVGVGLAFAVILASLMLVRGTCRLGSQLTVGSDRSLAALWALERIAQDLQRAGVGVRDGGVDERIELLLPGAVAMRADLDRDEIDESRDPEQTIGDAGEPVTTGNDEVIVFLRRRSEEDLGELIGFQADLDAPETVTLDDGTVVAKRDGVTERIEPGRAMSPENDSSATLYRVSFVHDADRFGTSRFRSAQPLLDRVASLRLRAFDAGGNEVAACGGEDDATARACRRSIRRLLLELRLEESADVFRREVLLARGGDQ
jgi:hypothetical protein